MKQQENPGPDMVNKHHLATMRFRMTDRMVKRYLEKRFMGTGVYRGQHQILMHLFWAPDSSQAQLAEHMEISPAAVAVSLKKLEKGGYVRRQNRREDNRSNQIEITEKGRQVVDISIEIFHELDRTLYRGFSPEETKQLCGYLDRMYANLAHWEQDAPGTG